MEDTINGKICETRINLLLHDETGSRRCCMVDITLMARQYGAVIPVAITANLLNSYVKPSHECEETG